jgi:glycosyltransferase involved in cell wall biosynthesis
VTEFVVPKVSVVIPTFGRPELLKVAVDSVLAQTLTDLELIVVVDGDDPATRAYLETVSDPRLRYIFHDTKKGAGQTRDTGADASLGEWVAFLDDDDAWLPQKLEAQLAVAPKGPAVLLTLSHVITPTGNYIRPGDPYTPNRPLDEWLFGRETWFKGGQSFIQTSSIMMPRDMFNHLHFRDTKQHEEWELVIRANKVLGYEVVTAPEPLVIHYDGQPRPSLSKTYTWATSLQWIDSMGDLITPKAYSGFCLTAISQVASAKGERDACLPLLKAAFTKGQPTLKQCFAFVLFWILPVDFRRGLRAKLDSRQAPTEAKV